MPVIITYKVIGRRLPPTLLLKLIEALNITKLFMQEEKPEIRDKETGICRLSSVW